MAAVSRSLFLASCTLFLFLAPVWADSGCESDYGGGSRSAALRLKIAAVASILAAGSLGVCLPFLSRLVPALKAEGDVFFVVKAFAAGVILATGFIHILPDAFENLGSPCLSEDPWGKFPFPGFVAMMSAVGTLMVDAFATGYYSRNVATGKEVDEEKAGEVRLHTHGTHGHSHGDFPAPVVDQQSADTIRSRVVSQVLELGIVVHSAIIGVSLGASQSPSTIRPLVVALSFHQFFEGMGLGGCLVQARFNIRSVTVMGLFFSLTTPVGITVGIGVSSVYNENSPTSLVVEGIFNSAAAGILIYMALVDLLAADYMSLRMQRSGKLQLWVSTSLLVGAGCMSLLAKWA